MLGEMLDAWMYGNGLIELEEFESQIEKVSTDDILALAREFFIAERRVEGVVRGAGKTV